MKNSCIWGIRILLLPAMLYSGQAFAVSEAGEIQRKEQKTPHAEMNVAHNITNIQFAEDSNIAGQNAVNFSADELTNDENSGLITASGEVEIEYNNMRLKTDKLIYDQNNDVVTANGNVRLYSSDGSIVYSDEVVLSEQMTTGEMHHIKVLLKDKSHVFAESFKKKNNQKKQLAYATYTPCDMCVPTIWERWCSRVIFGRLTTRPMLFSRRFILLTAEWFGAAAISSIFTAPIRKLPAAI